MCFPGPDHETVAGDVFVWARSKTIKVLNNGFNDFVTVEAIIHYLHYNTPSRVGERQGLHVKLRAS